VWGEQTGTPSCNYYLVAFSFSYGILFSMNQKQRKTLLLIFEKPTRSDLRYDDLKSFLISSGASFGEGRGSRVNFQYGNYSVHIHKPHPKKVLPK
jgi:hypothetical protein